MSTYNGTNKFELLTDEQALTEKYSNEGLLALTRCAVNSMLHSTTPRLVETTYHFASGYVDLHPIENLYLISNTLGARNSMSVNGEWGMLKKFSVSSD